jgi:hypothetical protein
MADRKSQKAKGEHPKGVIRRKKRKEGKDKPLPLRRKEENE